MSSRRVLKVAEAIREVVGMAILADLRDPRISDVTVTRVEVSGDLRQAKVHVSIMGDEAKQKLCLHGLRSATGYLQSKVGDRVDTRYTPRLEFVLDQGVKKSIEIAAILDREMGRGPLVADAESDVGTVADEETDGRVAGEGGAGEGQSDGAAGTETEA